LEAASSEQIELTGDFRAWCSQQMESLTGSPEVTLCEFLMGVESNSEIADYVRMYLGTGAPVATFSSEFIKRKLAVMAAREMTAAGKKKSRKARAKANKALAVAASGSDQAAAAKEVEDSSWEKVDSVGKKGKGAERTMSNGTVGAGLLGNRRASGFAVLSGGRGH
jgi:hypothetical protein